MRRENQQFITFTVKKPGACLVLLWWKSSAAAKFGAIVSGLCRGFSIPCKRFDINQLSYKFATKCPCYIDFPKGHQAAILLGDKPFRTEQSLFNEIKRWNNNGYAIYEKDTGTDG